MTKAKIYFFFGQVFFAICRSQGRGSGHTREFCTDLGRVILAAFFLQFTCPMNVFSLPAPTGPPKAPPRASAQSYVRQRASPDPPALARSAALTSEQQRAFGPLLPLIDHPNLRDVMVQIVNGAGRVWVDVDGSLREDTRSRFDAQQVHRIAVALIAAGGRHVDELNPCADVRLGDGIRVHAVLPPASVTGAAISIRLPGAEPPSFAELVAKGLCDAGTARTLQRAVAARKNVLIAGGTGTGKTTLLGALLDEVASDERIITIEDVAELRLKHPHRVALETRQPNLEGAGEITLDRLLREALRMRPDRIVLGECRGAELLTLLTALNTGHDGGAGTLHASRMVDVAARLEALGALGGLSPEALARQVCSALHLVVHLERSRSGIHHISALGEFVLHDGHLAVSPIRFR